MKRRKRKEKGREEQGRRRRVKTRRMKAKQTQEKKIKGILTQTIFRAAGAGISRYFHHGCAEGQADLLPLVLHEVDAGLVSHLGKCLGQQIRIPGFAQARSLRKLGREDGRHAGGPAQPVDAFGKGGEG